VQNSSKHLETGSSSADESSASEAVKMSQVSEETRRQRQDSSSSSSSSESESEAAEPQVESEDESSVSKSVSKSESANEVSVSSESAAAEPQPPQPRSRSVSVEEAVSPPAPAERKKSSASEKFEADIAEDTDEDVEKEDLEEPVMVQPVQPVPPVVIEPVEAEEPEAEPEVEPEVEEPEEPVPVPRKASLDNELTQDEVELSKRETVHLDEAEKAEVLAEVSRKSSTASSVSSASEEEMMETKSPVEAMPAAIIEEEAVNGQNGHINGRNGLKVEAGSSSDEDEAPKPPASPLNGRRSGTGAVTKIYTSAIDNNNKTETNNNIDKREKPTRDITQIYTQTLAKTDTPPASPKSAPRSRPANDITKLYTGKLDARARTPEPEKLSPPKKHNMSTAVDKDAIRGAYDDVRSDTSDTEWAVFKFDQNNRLGVTATGKDFPDFKAHFGNDDRGFGYIRIKTGDEMSKRAKFVMVTWIGPGVSVMKKAKMSTDKALMKDICQNMSVELQLETHGEFSHDNFKLQVDKASGARYGTGVRDL